LDANGKEKVKICMKKAIVKRIRITKSGKIMRRKMGIDHFRAKKSSGEKQEKRKYVLLNSKRFLKKLHSI
jgi:ribosomal protein L35